ncbi:hypothetical protein KAH27_00985 [bacterium]|nr:hypothetical protein [bacterium]
MKKQLNLSALIIIICFGFFVTGCAAIKESRAKETERMLSAAGFTIKLANTPEKIANLKLLTQETVFPFERNGTNYYIYANAHEKRLYVGNPSEYNEYKELKHQKQVSEDQIADARDAMMEANEEADYAGRMDWGMWAPYRY